VRHVSNVPIIQPKGEEGLKKRDPLMFLLDDILLAPIKGLATVCQKVHEAAQEDLENREKAILADLAELHRQLEACRIGDNEFNVRECALLDRLEACQAAQGQRS
jgi:hypothetical protein